MQGWTLRDGLWRNDGVTADAVATMRGGSLAFDPLTLQRRIVSWSDGTGDVIYQNDILPDNVTIGTPVELDYGWEYPASGDVTKIQVVDLQATNGLSYLRNFGDAGLKAIWWMPVSTVRDNGGGWWKPKRTRITTNFPLTVCPQDDFGDELTFDGKPCQPSWAKHSIAYYGGTHQQHNRLHADGQIDRAYCGGKRHHTIRPTALFWSADGRLLGIVYGRVIWIDSCEEKWFPLAECANFINGGAVEVSIDATLGWTTNGSAAPGSGSSEQFYARLGVASENGTVDSHSFNFYGSGTTNMMSAFYDEATYDATSYAPNSLISNSGSGSYARPTLDSTKTHTYTGTKPTISSGVAYWLALMSYNDGSANMNARYDNMLDSTPSNIDGSGRFIYDAWGLNAGSAITSPPATAQYDTRLLGTGAQPAHRRITAYLTYTASGGGGTPGAVYYYHHTRNRRGCC